ncbi:MAG: tRNA (N(6)-L-threonylcarbamoyladenosine(37)-C(2))-methylthiotransferase MtaB [Clostridiales bacterium]|jgi:threonylcarbamoyladenosine tRNA methylthiotransferase MtaB|nr:tRNA (N(6)-L-threonylcarbamoyladenosine(37)-C(2))-methylthiotransferase MtaB [Clostridiales bacterium]
MCSCKKSYTAAARALGCKVSSRDADALLSAFRAAGFEIVDFSEKADVYIINTCTVTNISDKKSRQTVSRALALNPEAVIAVAGCMSQVSPAAAAALRGVSIVAGTAGRAEIPEAALEMLRNGLPAAPVILTRDISQARVFDEETAEQAGRTRAYLKIQDGCDNFCSYCVIPYARGRSRSRALAAVRAEAERLAGEGFKEIVITGIHAESYGRDLSPPLRLLDAARAVSETPGVARARLSSLSPLAVTDEFLEGLTALGNVCAHFHLSLQSGCERTLAAMDRRYSAAFYAESARKIRGAFPGAALTTDIITGFPGETDRDFEESFRFCESVGFAKIHVFPFSPKKGTKAYALPGRVPASVKKERAARFLALSEESRRRFLAGFEGRVMPVLFERRAGGFSSGLTENYIAVSVREDFPPNAIAPVELTPENMTDYSNFTKRWQPKRRL